jgi:hypothetical protein
MTIPEIDTLRQEARLKVAMSREGLEAMEFREIPDVKGYKISDDGIVISDFNGGHVSPFLASKYLGVRLTDFNTPKGARGRKTHLIHRLVYQTFIGPIPKGMWVNHKDGNKLNNHVSNLELTTPKQNHAHSRDVLKRQWLKGDENPNSVLSELERKAIQTLSALGWSNNELATLFMVSSTTISKHKKLLTNSTL